MKISFDFDGVLDTDKGFSFCESLIHANRLCNGHGIPFDIWIVTTRFADASNEDLLNTINELGIPISKLRMTNHKWKWTHLDELEIELHIDDNPDEVHLINKNCKSCKALLIGLNINKLLMEGTDL